jgi:hypothetical protein
LILDDPRRRTPLVLQASDDNQSSPGAVSDAPLEHRSCILEIAFGYGLSTAVNNGQNVTVSDPVLG